MDRKYNIPVTKIDTRFLGRLNLDKYKKDLFNFRFQKMNSQITNPAKISETKRSIARLKTLLKEKINA